ncbi:MAG TPA: hypothetical protein VFO39_01505 [Candidatus Sulfotelmatobacter sp.]|nr:hypothetical protein [Candidatus Sulfotelmatobacter sp.]
MKTRTLALLTMLSVAAVLGYAQEPNHDDMQNCPMHKEHAADAHHAMVERHGDQGMGFSHQTTTHHFRMLSDGGAIEVTANSPDDKSDMNAIRSHLAHIAVAFGNGDFSTPMFVHDGVPPGSTTMQLLKSKIAYKYEELPSGGRVRIQSSDPVALAGIHDFLRFQIAEHQTGDSLEVADNR